MYSPRTSGAKGDPDSRLAVTLASVTRLFHARRAPPDAARRRRIAPKDPQADLWQETQCGDGARRSRQPAPDDPAVLWEFRPEDGRVLGRMREFVRFGATTTHSPIAAGVHPRSWAIRMAIRARMSIVVIKSLMSTIRVLSSTIRIVRVAACHATMSITPRAGIRERHLRHSQPASHVGEPRRHRLVEAGMATVQHPIEISALPEDRTVESRTERPGVCTDVPESHLLEPARLDQDRDSPRDAGPGTHVGLPQPPPDPDRPERGPDPLIIHPRMFGSLAYLALIARVTAGARGVDSRP